MGIKFLQTIVEIINLQETRQANCSKASFTRKDINRRTGGHDDTKNKVSVAKKTSVYKLAYVSTAYTDDRSGISLQGTQFYDLFFLFLPGADPGDRAIIRLHFSKNRSPPHIFVQRPIRRIFFFEKNRLPQTHSIILL